ncbi:MAG: late competence development ComFB family protein [Candidatus Omnitrophica bacterium]|nr:late competence development ComFB family protein [Candidatus Omnitrophota bacterium]
MELKNYMEVVVKEVVDLELKKIDAKWENDERRKLDVMALILNRLPARYVVTGKGWIMTKIKETESQFQADILREMIRAMKIVEDNPR